MCLIETHHFYHADHTARLQRYISTDPFSANREGDFIDPIVEEPCDCNQVFHKPRTTVATRASSFIGHFFECSSHNCCTVWPNVTFCQLLRAYRSQEDTENNLLEFASHDYVHCPNKLEMHLYHSRAFLRDAGTSGPAEPDTEAGGHDGDNSRQVPVFPADKLLYANNVLDEVDESANPDVCVELEIARDTAVVLARTLWAEKEEHRKAMKYAIHLMSGAELLFQSTGQYDPAADELFLSTFQALDNSEHVIAMLYREFLTHLQAALQYLGRLPGLEESYSSSDRSFSISHETLLLTKSDDESALGMCRGPLKASGTLFKRFDQLKDRVRVAHNNVLMGLHLRPEDVKVQKRK